MRFWKRSEPAAAEAAPAGRMKSLAECRLYGIIDLGYVEAKRAPRAASDLIKGGVDLIQLRGKEKTVDELSELAAELHKITAPAGVPLIINDHAEIAQRIPVEGVHVGQDDDSIVVVRKSVDRPIIIGKSTHSRGQAIAGQDEGADYVGYGPLFATPTKPDYDPVGFEKIELIHQDLQIPIFCIGGIKLENLAEVIAAGARRVVIVSGLLQAKNLVAYAQECKKLLAAVALPPATENLQGPEPVPRPPSAI